MRILVTGADGFIGRSLVARLCRDGLHPVAATRNDHYAFSHRVRRLVLGDFTQVQAWDGHLQNIDAVVHLVAVTHAATVRADEARYRRVNVAVTDALVAAAMRQDVKRFIFLSSIKVNGERSARIDATVVPLRAADPPRPQGPYGESKWAAERTLLKAAASRRIDYCILRPPLVYGPGQQGNLHALMRAVAAGVPLPLASIDNQRSLIYVENLCDAIVTVLHAPKRIANTFTLADCVLSTPDLVRSFARALGVAPRLFPVPARFLQWAGSLCGRQGTMTRLTESLLVDAAEFQQVFAWTPPIDLAAGMQRTASAFYERPRA